MVTRTIIVYVYGTEFWVFKLTIGRKGLKIGGFSSFLVTNQFLVVKIQKMTIWCHTWLESYRSVVY